MTNNPRLHKILFNYFLFRNLFVICVQAGDGRAMVTLTRKQLISFCTGNNGSDTADASYR